MKPQNVLWTRTGDPALVESEPIDHVRGRTGRLGRGDIGRVGFENEPDPVLQREGHRLERGVLRGAAGQCQSVRRLARPAGGSSDLFGHVAKRTASRSAPR